METPPELTPAAPERRGMSPNAKIVATILGGLLLVCLCASVLGVFALRRAGQAVEQAMATDPAEVQQIAAAIADYDLPPGYEEQMGMSFFGFDMVVLAQAAAGAPVIMLMQVPEGAGMDQEAMEEQMQRSMQGQGQSFGRGMEVVGTETATIRGEEVTLTVREGEDEAGDTLRQVSGVFPGKGGSVLLMIMGDVAQWDQALVDDFLASLR